MKHLSIASFVVLSAAMAAGPHAQTSTTPSTASPVTVTGCVERASQTPSGTAATSSTASTAVPDTKFVLAKVTAGNPAGTTSAPSSTVSAAAAQYRLDADESKLAPHVGHKVEITGTVQEQGRSPATTGTSGTTATGSPTTGAPTTGAPTTGSAIASGANSPKLKVDSVKMISSTCP